MMATLAERAMHEVRWRSFWRDDGKAAAQALNISRSHLLSLRNGTAAMTDATAQRILAAAREEELALADKIERELNAHWYAERREARQAEHRARECPRYPQGTAMVGEIPAENHGVTEAGETCGQTREPSWRLAPAGSIES